MHVSSQVNKLGNAAMLHGWRRAIGDRVAPAVARRTSAREDQIRAVLGILLLGLSLKFVLGTLRGFRSA